MTVEARRTVTSSKTRAAPVAGAWSPEAAAVLPVVEL
jgi:hypothetical protein